MVEGINLLQEIKAGSYQAAIFGSYNVSFPFFEEVVLRALRSHGCDHNVLLMDATQCALSLADRELAPQLGGRHYALVPVVAPGAFHPKFMLLLGKRNSKLFIGSHNLTLSGFGMNREVTNVISIADRETEALGQVVFEFGLSWARTVAPELGELVDASRNWAPWLNGKRGSSGDVSVLGTLRDGPSLWDQLRSQVHDNVKRITVVGPYFDNGLRFITSLQQEYSGAELVVGLNPKHTNIDAARAKQLSDVAFIDAGGWLADDPGRVVHAKALYIELNGGESLLVSGSANPSAPAWVGGERRNAELVLLRRLKKDDPLPDALGLKALRQCPLMTEAAWQATNWEGDDKDDRERTERAWVALETDRGFVTDKGFASSGTELVVMDRDSSTLTRAVSIPDSEARTLIPLADPDFRARASHLEASHNGIVGRAIVQHLRELQERATSEKQRSLRKALMDLDSADDGFDSYLSIIEKAIFDEEPVPRHTATLVNSRTSVGSSGSGAAAIGELDKRGARKVRLSAGNIGLVLDVLIHKLGDGLNGVFSVPRTSEEQIDENTELPGKRFTRDEQKQLAHRCRLKTRRLMQRMSQRLALAEKAKAAPFAVIVQLCACLGLLHRLNERAPKFQWLPRGEKLVETNKLWDLFKAAALHGFAREIGAADVLLKEYGDSSDVASATALLLWSAWETGLDLAIATSRQAVNDGVRDENLVGLSLLLNCLRPALLPDDDELQYLFGERGCVWLGRHLAWANAIRVAQSSQGQVRAGSIVRFRRDGSHRVGVVVKVVEGKVDVMDGTKGDRIKYLSHAVEKLEV